jgi:hypothetical protein
MRRLFIPAGLCLIMVRGDEYRAGSAVAENRRSHRSSAGIRIHRLGLFCACRPRRRKYP